MNHGASFDRREFLGKAALGTAFAAGAISGFSPRLFARDVPPPLPIFQISLAQWSLHRALFAGELDTPGFVRAARDDYSIGAVEYVNAFFKEQVKDEKYLAALKKTADDAGVWSLLIMCDGLGRLGDPDKAARTRAIENHRPWLHAAKTLGCHSIRVNAASSGERAEQVKLAADGLRRLSELGETFSLNVIVENHGGLSSDGAWLAEVMRTVDHPRCGTLPDFGNFQLGDGKWYDRYRGVEELMPFAKAVSAKSHAFDAEGHETKTDYRRMLGIVLDAGYRGYVGIEFEGNDVSEPEGIRRTKTLLEKVRSELASSGKYDRKSGGPTSRPGGKKG